MSRRHCVPGLIRPRPHPIVCAADALALIALARHEPMEPEIVAFLLDADGVGGTVVVVTDVVQHDAVVGVVDTMCTAAAGTPLSRLVIASVRPCGAMDADDAARWLDADVIARLHDVELIEWFVIGPAGTEHPRDLLGHARRW